MHLKKHIFVLFAILTGSFAGPAQWVTNIDQTTIFYCTPSGFMRK